jgi:hypothetical protein
MFSPATLWQAPLINPVNKKARSIPALNPFNMYGRVFFFSWFGFMIAFWSCRFQYYFHYEVDIRLTRIRVCLPTTLVRRHCKGLEVEAISNCKQQHHLTRRYVSLFKLMCSLILLTQSPDSSFVSLLDQCVILSVHDGHSLAACSLEPSQLSSLELFTTQLASWRFASLSVSLVVALSLARSGLRDSSTKTLSALQTLLPVVSETLVVVSAYELHLKF